MARVMCYVSQFSFAGTKELDRHASLEQREVAATPQARSSPHSGEDADNNILQAPEDEGDRNRMQKLDKCWNRSELSKGK